VDVPRHLRVPPLIAKERFRLSPGDGAEEVLARLRADEVIANDAIAVIEELFGLPFNEAKDVLANSAAYSAIVRASLPAQDAAEVAIRQLADE
jgi:hypothetical protein